MNKTTDVAAGDGPVVRESRGSRGAVMEAREDGLGAADAERYQPLWVRLACIGLDFLTQTYDQIRIVPEIVLFEQYVCRAHYAQDAGSIISPGLCKAHDVQYQLARLRSWKALFDGIAGRGMEDMTSPLRLFSLTTTWQSSSRPFPWAFSPTGSGGRR